MLTRSFSSTLKDYQLTLTQSQLIFKFYAYESYAYDMMQKSRIYVVYVTRKRSRRDFFCYFRNPKSYKISLFLQNKVVLKGTNHTNISLSGLQEKRLIQGKFQNKGLPKPFSSSFIYKHLFIRNRISSHRMNIIFIYLFFVTCLLSTRLNMGFTFFC